jgi:hypothetical protein
MTYASIEYPDFEFPEPPDGTRMEFVWNTDVYAIHRDDKSSAEVGWTPGPGGETWCFYPNSVPTTWKDICGMVGPALNDAIYLVPTAMWH